MTAAVCAFSRQLARQSLSGLATTFGASLQSIQSSQRSHFHRPSPTTAACNKISINTTIRPPKNDHYSTLSIVAATAATVSLSFFGNVHFTSCDGPDASPEVSGSSSPPSSSHDESSSLNAKDPTLHVMTTPRLSTMATAAVVTNELRQGAPFKTPHSSDRFAPNNRLATATVLSNTTPGPAKKRKQVPCSTAPATTPVSTSCTNGTKRKRVNNATRPSNDNKNKPPKKTKITQGIGSQPATIDFRYCVDDLGIDMLAREKLNHSHKPVADPRSIQHEGVRKIYQAVEAYFRWFSKQNFKYKNGEPVVPNRPSLPLGLDEDADLVGLVLCYATLEEAKPLHAHGRSVFTAKHSEEDTLVCRTLEFARLALTDPIYFSMVLLDAYPVAFPYESTLEGSVETEIANEIMQEWESVLSVVFDVATVGIGSSTALAAVQEVLPDLDTNQIISAMEDRYHPPPHPSSLYNKMKQSNLGTKLSNCTTFYSSLITAVDPDAPPTTVFEQFGDKNSALVRFMDNAGRVASIKGGKASGFVTKKKKLQEAVNREQDIYLIECTHKNNMAVTGCKGEKWTIAPKTRKKDTTCLLGYYESFKCLCKGCSKNQHTQWTPVPELGRPLTTEEIAIALDSLGNDESLSDVMTKLVLGVSEDEFRQQIRQLEKEAHEDKLVKIEDMYNLNDFEDPFPFLSLKHK